jgi:saxitoxin biosynthesis operon SxtJ-like protein
MTSKGPKNPERSFGLSVGVVLCLIAAFLAWRGRLNRAEILGAVGVVLVVLGLGAPSLLKWPSDIWWRVARVLGYVNARILLTVLFGIALVPLSMAWKLIGVDPLERRRDRWPGWSPYPDRYRDHRHYSRMY